MRTATQYVITSIDFSNILKYKMMNINNFSGLNMGLCVEKWYRIAIKIPIGRKGNLLKFETNVKKNTTKITL